jgi:2-polyprenyl-3-methyl-5-hydroxy-6-metoxy-1,4-benzoquinol methylase
LNSKQDVTCRVCGSSELVPVATLPNYPLVTGPVTRIPRTVPTCTLEIGRCQQCGLCVLLNTDTDELAYDDDYTSSGITYGQVSSVDAQTDRFVSFIGEAGKPPGSKVLEIGCYDGDLMGILAARYGFNMSGCEPCVPAVKVARENGHDVRLGLFNADDYSGLDMVVVRNVLEHIAFPNQFLKGVASSLKDDGVLVVEVPNGEHYILKGILGTIVPQHSCYFGQDSLARLMLNHFDESTTEGDRATIRMRASTPDQNSLRRSIATDEVRLRLGMLKRQRRYDIVRKTIGDEEFVDIFGANSCALELIAAGAVKLEQIDKVFDDDHYRWNKYLVNTNLTVSPRTAVERGRRRKVLVCSYTHRDTIAEYITEQGSTPVKLYKEDE